MSSYKNYAAVKKIENLQNKLSKYEGNNQEEVEEILDEDNMITLDSILNTPTNKATTEKEIIAYPQFGTITGARNLDIGIYRLGELVQEYEAVYPTENKPAM